LFGFILYFLLLFLPGFTLTQVLGVKTSSSLEKFTISASLGISLNIILLSLMQLVFRGLNRVHIYSIILISIVTLVILQFYSREKLELVFDLNDKMALFLYLGHLGFLSLHFLKFPIFPNSSSGDFIIHLKYSQQLIWGEKSIVNLGYYPGVEVLIGAGLLLVQGEKLVVMRQVMSLLVGFLTLIIYNTGFEVFNSKRKALLASLLYSFSPAFWYDSLYISGLYANILTNIIALSSIYFIVKSTEDKIPIYYFLVFLSGASLILSHSTSIIFLILIWSFVAIIRIKNKRIIKQYIRSIAVFSLPVLGVFFYPDFLSRLKNILSGQYVKIEARNPIFEFFEPISPFFAYISGYMGVVLTILAVTGMGILLLRLHEKGKFWSILFPSWFLLNWVLSIQGRQVWRFALLAKIPSIFLIGYLLDEVIISLKEIIGANNYSSKIKGLNFLGLSTVLISTILISGGLLNYTLSNLAFEENFQRQNSIYNSMQWISKNTENDSKILVISEWEYIYLPQISQRETYYISINSNYNVSQITENARGNLNYLISSKDLIHSFRNPIYFEEEWSNSIITIFSVLS